MDSFVMKGHGDGTEKGEFAVEHVFQLRGSIPSPGTWNIQGVTMTVKVQSP